MPHQLPVRELLAPWREIGELARKTINAGFASDLWPEIREFDVAAWVCGHSHDNQRWTGEGRHGPIRFATNARGDPREDCAFDPGFTLEIESVFR